MALKTIEAGAIAAEKAFITKWTAKAGPAMRDVENYWTMTPSRLYWILMFGAR